jgi:hypothetical protein
MEPDASSSVGGRLGEGELLSHRPYPANDPCLHPLIRGAGRITVPNDLWVCIQEIRRAVPPNPPEYYAVPGSSTVHQWLSSDGAVSVL